MNPKRKIKLLMILSSLLLLSAATGLVLYALKQNIDLFYTPTELLNAHLRTEKSVRLGGYVAKNSVHYDPTGKTVTFLVTDRKQAIKVVFSGILPNLFREGQTVIVTGTLSSARFLIANEVLAKHDEKYMPKSLSKQLGVS